MRDAESLLFVHHEQPEVAELHVFREQPVRADDDVDLAGGEIFQHDLLFRLRAKPADHVDPDREAREALRQRPQVLEREDRRRGQEGDLLAVHDGLEGRAHRDFRLAVADVAAEQPIHRRRGFHVGLDVGNRRRLVRRQIVRKAAFEFLLPVRVCGERVAGNGFTRGVELEQLFGHVAHRLLDARLGLLPRLAAQPIDGRTGGAGVLLDEIEPFDRHEQLVLARVAELHELLRRLARRDRQLLQPDEDADAVVDVHDEVADFEIAQIGEERARGRPASLLRPAALLFEDVGLGVYRQLAVRQAETAGQVPDGDEQRREVRVLGAIGRRGDDLVVACELDHPLGASGGGRHEDRLFAVAATLPQRVDEVLDTSLELGHDLTAHVMHVGRSSPDRLRS